MSWLRVRESPVRAVRATRTVGALDDPKPQAAKIAMTMRRRHRVGCAMPRYRCAMRHHGVVENNYL